VKKDLIEGMIAYYFKTQIIEIQSAGFSKEKDLPCQKEICWEIRFTFLFEF